MALISQMMKTDVVTVQAQQSVAEVAQLMKTRGIGAVLLVSDEKLAGIFSERDLLRRVVAAGLEPNATKVGEVATSELATVSAETHVKACAEILRAKRIRHLPVVDGAGKPVGIVSARDFFAYSTEELERFIDRGRYEKEIDEGDDPYDHFGGSYDR